MYADFLTAFFFELPFSHLLYILQFRPTHRSVFFWSAVENMQFFHYTLDRNLYHGLHCMHNFTTV